MGILNRVAKIVKSNISELLERSRDPVDALERFIGDLDEDLSAIKAEIAESRREEHRLDQRCDEEESAIDHWHRHALRALQRGEEDLAREALRRKRRAQRALDLLQSQLSHQQRVSSGLRSHLEELQLKLEEARLHKEHLAVNQRIHERRRRASERATRWPELGETFEKISRREAPDRPRGRTRDDEPYLVETPLPSPRHRDVELPPTQEPDLRDEYDRRFRDLELADLRQRKAEGRKGDDSFVEEELRRLKKEQKKGEQKEGPGDQDEDEGSS